MRANPAEFYYYLNGVQIGDIGNNGPSATDYASAINQRQVLPSNTSPWANATSTSAGSAVQFSDFTQGYFPVSPSTTDAAIPTSYTVREGDTLAIVAQKLWGDANL